MDTMQRKKSSKGRASQTKTGRKGGMQGTTTNAQGVNVHPMAAAAAGAVVGAAVGAVAGAVLSNDKTRKQAGDAIQSMRDRAMDTMKKVSDSAPKTSKVIEDAKDLAGKKISEIKEK
jgi:hypothetical protein